MYRLLGHDRAGAAKLLHVTPRTVFNWETGRVAVPFAQFKLLRLLTRSELPDAAWSGWCFNRGTLWSPQGYGFKPQDFAELGRTVRMARLFPVLYAERGRLERELVTVRGERDRLQALMPCCPVLAALVGAASGRAERGTSTSTPGLLEGGEAFAAAVVLGGA